MNTPFYLYTISKVLSSHYQMVESLHQWLGPLAMMPISKFVLGSEGSFLQKILQPIFPFLLHMSQAFQRSLHMLSALWSNLPSIILITLPSWRSHKTLGTHYYNFFWREEARLHQPTFWLRLNCKVYRILRRPHLRQGSSMSFKTLKDLAPLLLSIYFETLFCRINCRKFLVSFRSK